MERVGVARASGSTGWPTRWRPLLRFDEDDALIVWSHRKFGQENRGNALGIAHEGGANHARLFDWWQFWVHRIGLSS